MEGNSSTSTEINLTLSQERAASEKKNKNTEKLILVNNLRLEAMIFKLLL